MQSHRRPAVQPAAADEREGEQEPQCVHDDALSTLIDWPRSKDDATTTRLVGLGSSQSVEPKHSVAAVRLTATTNE